MLDTFFFTVFDSLIVQHQYDQKNIRRRVYDALNVLIAMNIISKEKKEIKWIGLPTNSRQECDKLETEKRKRLDSIRQKKSQLQELLLQVGLNGRGSSDSMCRRA